MSHWSSGFFIYVMLARPPHAGLIVLLSFAFTRAKLLRLGILYGPPASVVHIISSDIPKILVSDISNKINRQILRFGRQNYDIMRKQRTLLLTHSIFLILIMLLMLWLVQFPSAVAAPAQQEGQDLAAINDPASNAVVRGSVQIIGSSDHPSFQFYAIEFSPEPVTGDQWQIIGATHNTPVINGVLETWDTTLVPDGSYTLRLRTVRLDGNYTEAFSQQVVVSNTQSLPTDTPTVASVEEIVPGIPTETPTPLPPTPTVIVEQPIVETPTPRAIETTEPLEDPNELTSFVPTVTGFALSPLKDACIYGAGIMLSVFLLFGFLAALRVFVMGFIDRIRRKS
jgi:hypothetical protein